MSKPKVELGVVPKITPVTDEFKTDALRVLDEVRGWIEDGAYHSVAVVVVDIDGAGNSVWSTSCHRIAMLGHTSVMLHRLGKKFTEDE